MARRLSDFTTDETLLHVWGESDALEISSPHEGVLRVRYAPGARRLSLSYPRLPEKRSFAVVGGEAQALHVEPDETTLRVSGGGLKLDLDLADGLWQAWDADGHSLARATEVRADPASLRHKTGLSLHAPPQAAYLGFGEKVGGLDRRGLRFTFWNTDHFPYHTDSDPLYASVPFCTVLEGGRAGGLFLDESWRMEVDVASLDSRALAWSSAGPELDLYVIAGPGIADVLRRYTALTGRTPLPPLWSLGYVQSRWGYENEDDVRAVIEGFRSRNVPLDAVCVDIDYMDAYKVFTWDPQRFTDPAGLLKETQAGGVQLVPIIDPGVKVEAGYPVYEEAVQAGYLVRNSRGDVLIGEVWPKPAVFPDFTREEVVSWWASHFAAFASAGVHGVWNDMNEPSCFTVLNVESDLGEVERSVGLIEGKTLPYDARHGKRRHLEVHNAYNLGMNEAARLGFLRAYPDRRPFLISRSGFAGLQRYGALWTGDNTSAWSHLRLSIPMLLGLGLSGLAHCGADVGGFVGDANGELLTRWTQLGAFYPFMRNHSAAGTRDQEPWRFGDEVLNGVRQAIELRYRLLPTLYTLMWEAGQSGLPPMRPLTLHDPHDPDALREDGTFLFGPDLLVAPVLEGGVAKRLTYLPAGRWLELFNVQGGGQIHEGGQSVVAQVGLNTVPVYLRAGGAVALTESAAHTTHANWPALTWHVHAADRIAGRLYEDAGDGYGPSRVTTLRGERDGDTLRLTREVRGELAPERQEETLYLYGLSAPQSVSGALSWAFENGALRLGAQADWGEITIVIPA